MSCGCPSVVDALDYTEKWLKDTVTWLRETRAEGSGGASADVPSSPNLNVHNQAYLRLLLWDHVSDSFPEVSPVGHSRPPIPHPRGILSGSFPLLAPPQTVLMDQVRFQQMQQETEQLVLLSSVLLIVYTNVGEAATGLPKLMDTLKDTVGVLLADTRTP